MAHYSLHLDWMTITHHNPDSALRFEYRLSHDAQLLAVRTLREIVQDEPGKLLPQPASRFYPYVFIDPNSGIRVSVPTNLEQQGVRLEIGGESFRRLGGDGRAVLSAALQRRWHVTRLDVALNIHGIEIEFDKLLEHQAANWAAQRRQTIAAMARKTGAMITAGSRSSERYVRIYDKALETGIAGQWWRIELEAKGKAATVYAPALVENLTLGVAVMATLLGQWPETVTQHLQPSVWGMLDPIPKLPVTEITDRTKWYAHSVVPALRRLGRENPVEYQIVARWLNEVMNDRRDLAQALSNDDSQDEFN